ncbi:MAG TPA: lysophospholipid acyltransferase family protein [Euzebyales bacterium]|nr:lysophospholipid acyltransferase family protein [Euzebyales bacterium]
MGTPTDPTRAPPLYVAIRAVLRPIVLGALHPTVEGLANVPDEGPAILCSNHLSMLDPILVPLLLDRPIVFLAKSEYFHAGPFRWLFDALGVVPVARAGGSAARAGLDRGTDVLRAGGLLCLFPEGTRSPDGRLYRGKTGPIRLARRSGAPIVPVGLIGTREVIPPHTFVPRLGAAVTVRFGAQLLVGDRADLRSEADRLMGVIRTLTGQTYVDAYARPVQRARVSRDALDAFGERHDAQSGPGANHDDRR